MRHFAAFVQRAPFDTSTAEGRSKERYRRVALTVASGAAARVVAAAVNLVTVPMLLSYLGKEQFGLWSTLLSAVAWLGLCDLGIANGLVNVTAEAHGRDDRQSAARALSTAVAVLSAAAAFVGATFLVLLPRIPWDAVLGARAAIAAPTVQWSVAAAVGGFLIGLPMLTVASVYAGYQRSYVAHLFAAGTACASLAAVAAAIRMRAPLPGVIALMSAASVLVAGASLVALMTWQMPWLRIRVAHVRIDAWRRLRRTAGPLWLFQVGALMVNQSQLLILAHTAGLQTSADYVLLMRVMQIFVGVVVLSTSAFVPPYREAFERGDRHWVRAGFARMVALRVGLAGGFAGFLLLFGNPLMRLWLQRGDVTFAPAVWAAFGLSLLAGTWVSSFTDLLIVLDRIWVQVGLVLINGIATVLLTLRLAPMLGVLGVIVAGMAVTVLAWTWLLPLLARPVLAGSRP